MKNKKIECAVNGCDCKHYAKGFCKKHYSVWNRTGDPIPKARKNRNMQCSVAGCDQKAKVKTLCLSHYRKARMYGDPTISRNNKGKNNPQWKGGVAEYKNHYLMKQNRLIKLEQQNNKCEVCGLIGNEVHHKDNTKENHSIGNLIVLCRKCHMLLHAGRKNKTTKFIRIYGMTLTDMKSQYGMSVGFYYNLHIKGQLSQYLKIKKMLNNNQMEMTI